MVVLVLGDMHFDNIYPTLNPIAERIVVMATRPPEGRVEHGPNVEWRPVNTSLDRYQILELIKELEPDLVLSRIRGTENETQAIEHAFASRLAPPNVSFFAHPPDFAAVAADKVLFHQAALRLNLPVPRGVVCTGLADALEAVTTLGGYPVILKQGVCRAGSGVFFITERALLEHVCREKIQGPFLVQEALQGDEVGLEVVSSEIGTWQFPLISMGRLDESLNPQARLRMAPFPVSDSVTTSLRSIVCSIESAFRPNGPWQLDMAIRSGQLYILEVNARLGGLSNLSFRSTNTDPHVVACCVAMGQAPPQPQAVRVALEIPVRPNFRVNELFESNIQVYIQPSRSQPNWKLVMSSSDLDMALTHLDGVAEDDLLVPVGTLRRTMREAFASEWRHNYEVQR